jgi:hypothetical protein
MDRDFRNGHLGIDFPTEPFHSPGHVVLRSTRIFFATLPFLTMVTLAVMVPAKLAVQFACFALNVPAEGLLSYVVISLTDLLFSALVIQVVVFGLVEKLRCGRTGSFRESLRWGRRQWAKSAWNKFKVEITIALWSLLLVIPGIVVMVRLIFTDVIVAIEADQTTEVLPRSRALAAGHGWRIFLALLPALPLGLLHLYAGLRALQYSRWLMALLD